MNEGDRAAPRREGSAVPFVNSEKWSHRQLLRGKMCDRSVCRNSRVAANSGQNPGFDFLLSCWNDDRRKQIVIKKGSNAIL